MSFFLAHPVYIYSVEGNVLSGFVASDLYGLTYIRFILFPNVTIYYLFVI